ncbi:MAG: S26 family signal peptidase [Thermoguttaceae bacterium]
MEPQSQSRPSEATLFQSIRELCESFAIALVLVFTTKMFLLELFIIPTGSMAPTLRGFHKDAPCRVCGYPVLVGASEEFPEASGDSDISRLVLGGVCPQCRFPMYLGRDNAEAARYPSFKGDRILVRKYHLGWQEPSRWDVTVFRYPARAQVNYIKRLVGLPNETVRVEHGDVFVKRDGDADFAIQRKPLKRMKAMLQTVYDNNYAVNRFGITPRWNSDNSGDATDKENWKRSDDGKSFTIAATPEPVSLNYHNLVPTSSAAHTAFRDGTLPPTSPQIITDFTGYNTGVLGTLTGNKTSSDGIAAVSPNDWLAPVTRNAVSGENGASVHDVFCTPDPRTLGLNWVGDLAMSFCIAIKSQSGVLQLTLVKGGTQFTATIDVATGVATLAIPEVPDFVPVSAATPIIGTGTHTIFFSNIDEEMRLVVDGDEIEFGNDNSGGRYNSLCDRETIPQLMRKRSPQLRDLSPVSITVTGLAATVSDLHIERDIYYIAAGPMSSDFDRICDTLYPSFRAPLMRPRYSRRGQSAEEQVANFFSQDSQWNELGKTQRIEFSLGADEFLMFGDNSARSKDSRLWTDDGIPSPVPRELLIGEAVLVYWPHGLLIPFTQIALVPNLTKMRLIY